MSLHPRIISRPIDWANYILSLKSLETIRMPSNTVASPFAPSEHPIISSIGDFVLPQPSHFGLRSTRFICICSWVFLSTHDAGNVSGRRPSDGTWSAKLVRPFGERNYRPDDDCKDDEEANCKGHTGIMLWTQARLGVRILDQCHVRP